MINGLHHKEFPDQHYKASYLDQHIVEKSFFHNLVIIRKGHNDEETSSPGLIKRELALGKVTLGLWDIKTTPAGEDEMRPVPPLQSGA